MPSQVIGWFPDKSYAHLYLTLVMVCLLSDEVIPLLRGGRGASLKQGRDRGSYILIYCFSMTGLIGSLIIRYRDWGVVPFWLQVLGWVILVIGTLYRDWAVALLGRFFSRTVEIEQGHRLIQDGPYAKIRHPAYTGMILMYTGIVLGLGTWLGFLLMLVMILIPTLYRIQVEEKVLIENFGVEYEEYMRRTWRLFPGW